MHKIFIDKGIFSIIVQLPKILYSTIISLIISELMKFLAMTERNLLKLRKIKDSKKLKEESLKDMNNIKIKLNIFCIIGFLFMLFFWYYISCFCAVYKNTKTIFFENTFLSFFTSLIYPFAINLIPGLFRIYSLKKENRNCCYTFSKIVALI